MSATHSAGAGARTPMTGSAVGSFLAAGTTPQDTEEGRALLQARLARFGRFVFSINVVFYVLSILLIGFLDIDGRGFNIELLWRDLVKSLLIGSTTYGAVWFIASRGKIGAKWLYAIDRTAIFILSVGHCIGVWTLDPIARPELLVILTLSGALAIRAVMIPSSAARSLWVAFLAIGPTVVLTYYFYREHAIHVGSLTPTNFAVITAFLALPTVIITSYISNTIYGLTEQVREATQLGQYTLEEKIGEGGMGVVYKAHHSMLRRPTAVKLLPPERAGEHNLSRFEREVQLTSMLTHPNTIAIYDFGRTPEGVFYYAMEYLDGVDLEKLVEQCGPIDPARAIHIVLQVAGALEEAHGIGLIHRDIKPANIILCERGLTPDVAKVLDFGLVKRMEGTSDDSLKSAVNTITGTPLFLSPEAILRPDTVDGRSDLYALGCVGYYLLAGAYVFDAPTMIEICGLHVHTPPTPPSARLGRALPADLELVIMSCLAKSPAERPRDATALAEALRSCAEKRSWDPKAARRWWEEHGRQLKKGEHPIPASGPVVRPRTMAIDLRKRVSQG
ncbi:MAG: serine/threonine-protein kinase [Polyangiaceae bacterium]